MNNTSFVGNLVADPILRTGQQSGKNRATFTIAVNEGERGTDSEKTTFVDVTAFGTLGENLVASAKRGQRLLVIGRFDQYEQDLFRKDPNNEAQVVPVKIKRLSFIASAVGPDLRWASAQITANPRQDNTQGGQNGGYAAPQQVAQPQVAQPQVAQPQVAQPQVAQPQVAQPQVQQVQQAPQVAQPQVAPAYSGGGVDDF
ncbi:single-stranded DNA-binding protein [Nocardioides sp. Leaf285]|uniref:single-stranded DNA-binding protein n=1 Tax=Nocardioides sp. Leaf285 TaxID=1736322 RepID=UPI000702735D|nr:single-stranded DNA-binding protein [Nocardioides sp. Leaf285]KQP62870.1 hypothetical protein ASF47_17815 [Nocardioides sp. Leaf285]